MTAAIRIGLIGASRIAVDAIIAPARRMAGIEVAAVAARDPARASAYAEEHGISRAHPSYEVLMSDPEIDLVYVSTTPVTHAHLAIQALLAGKSVLVEKPFSMTASEALTVQAAAADTGGQVWEAMHSPHHTLFRQIESLVHGGCLGRIRHLEAEFSAPIRKAPAEFRWRADHGGGALMDLGVYPLAWCRRLCGEAFEVVAAEAMMERGVDAAFRADLVFAGGTLASVRASMLPASSVARLFISGDAGTLEVDNPLSPQAGHSLTLSDATGVRVVTAEGPTTYEAQLEAVRGTLKENQPFPFPADDYVRSMEAIEKVKAAFR